MIKAVLKLDIVELALLVVLLACQGSCIYLRMQEIQKIVRISDIKKGTEVMSLRPLSFLQEELEPRRRADYSIEDERKCSSKCRLQVDSEGRVIFNTQPKVNTSLTAVARVTYQGYNSTTIIKLRFLNTSTPLECLPPTQDDCFSGNYSFRVAAQEGSTSGKEILLGSIGSSSTSHCYKTQYVIINNSRRRDLVKKFRLVGDMLYVISDDFDDGYNQIDLRIKCSAWLYDSKDNSTRKGLIKPDRGFPVTVLHSTSLPYPSGSQTRIIMLPNNTFHKGSSLLLHWFWAAKGSKIQSKNINDSPANTQLSIETVSSDTFNLRSDIYFIHLNWTKPGVISSNVTFTISITIHNNHPVLSIYHQADPRMMKLTVILKVDPSMQRVNYTTDTLPANEYLSPFSHLAAPTDVRTLYKEPLLFRSAMPSFIQTPYNVTEKGGIVYLKDWGPQAFPCQGNCPQVFIIEWTRSGSDYERRRVLGSKVFRVVVDKKTGVTGWRCKDQGKSEIHWDYCSKHDDPRTCNRSCGLGAYNGVESLCSWREAKNPVTSTSSPNQVLPSTSPLTVEFSTCRADPRNCPDHWCDPLEQLYPIICPQDCSDYIVGGIHNDKTGLGIYSASMHSVCTCTDSLMCHCLPAIPRNKSHDDSRDHDEDIETELRFTTSSPFSSRPHQYESLNTDTDYCDMTCKTAIAVSSTLLFLITATIIFIRKRRCLSLSKIKGTGTEEGTLSIDPLVPLQTISTSPTVTDSTLEHNCEIDVKWELPRSRVEILDTLGEGEFGKVLKARAKDLPSKQGLTTVAVKTLKDNAGTLELNDLLSEYQLLKEINHPNVIKLLAACTTSDGPIYLIIEYCTLGSLRNYLRKNRNAKAHECLEAGSVEVTPKDILSFSWQICKGMSYLAEMKMVHRDLATRNILLAENKKCKISDFGMTRDVYVDDTYLKVSRSRVPVKWMALESLREHIYTSKSDVWSMGIVLWELVTLGASPYPAIPAEKLYGLLTSGYRMPRPSNCSNRLYEVMRECWIKEPYRRPTFQQLVGKFESMLGEEIEYLNCNINAFSNPAYFNGKPNKALNNLDIRFSMSLDDLKSLDGGLNPYENELDGCLSSFNYDVPRPQNIYVQSKKVKDKIIDEKVDNR